MSVYLDGKHGQVGSLWKSRQLLLYIYILNVSFLTPNLLKFHFIVSLELTLISVLNGLEETTRWLNSGIHAENKPQTLLFVGLEIKWLHIEMLYEEPC